MLDNFAVPTSTAGGLRRAMIFGAGALVLVTIVLGGIWFAIAGRSGLWGVLIGSGIGGAFILTTLLLTLVTINSTPEITAAVNLGGWLLKVVVLMVVIYFIRDLDFYHRGALMTTIVGVLVCVLGAETLAIVKSKTPYIGN
ncbi:hypothetical protein ACFPVT_08620 [Corynebacterium choanae]|uniref:ATP synthase I chain n=1 Tax=Corynebacterium choanae TaxID=1862358 RepID=A0A3G6J673_9CORY|nr:hypothetical protein [Corynebacterium choanae]AZA13322.1 hypothetical protein CCHOA_04570 [Corynebacterium choanae]